MYITKFRLLNYKSYGDSNEIEFKPGFNVITGQNSAGKTALLEADDTSVQRHILSLLQNGCYGTI